MIGVLAESSDRAIISEFFELFKTSWEFYRDTGQYQALICSRALIPHSSAKVVLVYGDDRADFDQEHGIEVLSEQPGAVLTYDRQRLPVYGKCLTFRDEESRTVRDEQTGASAIREIVAAGKTFVRVGFDLFHEVGFLLRNGQPIANARIPTLELHIALLRHLILRHSAPLVEIPPIPATHNFTACLTHDVDHAGIRHHKCDHTMFGFVWRATIGSLNSFCRGRKSFRQLAANLMAAFSLPFVYLGWAKDFWSHFDRYIDIEPETASTFFIIPKKMEEGEGVKKPASWKRATKYDVNDVPQQLNRIASAGNEIGLHGIDAWHNAERAAEERKGIENAIGSDVRGVRMHWLCFDEDSPRTLEQAGFSYDSTIGYNETIGYRAGTTQVFKPPQVTRMLELPMHIMDTALFYPGYLNLSPRQARSEVSALADNARRFGGVLTINWHDRSIAPERLWNKPYQELVDDLKSKCAWFATGTQAVSWFRKRRAAAIDVVTDRDGASRVRVSLDSNDDRLPGLRLRVHTGPSDFVDTSVNESTEVELAQGRNPQFVK